MPIPPWLLKLLATEALKPQNLKKLVFLVIGVFFGGMLLITSFFQPISFLLGELITTDYDITQSAVFKEVYPVYEDYKTEFLETLDEKAEEIKELHKEWVEDYTFNEETQTQEPDGGHYEYPTVNITFTDPPLDILLAYIVQKDSSILKNQEYKANEEQIKGFFNEILRVEVTGSDMDYTVQALFLNEEEVKEQYFVRDSDKNMFLQSLTLVRDFLNRSGFGMGGMGGLNLSGSALETMQRIYNGMITAGYSDAVAAGICGNIQQECSFNYQLSGAANGMVQWMGARFTRLKKLAEENGTEWADLDIQIEFLIWEMKSSAYVGKLNQYASRYGGVSKFSDVDDPEIAAFIFCAIIEGCEYNPDKGWGIANGSITGPDGKRWQQLEQRQAFARQIYLAMATGGSSSLGNIANGSSSEKLAVLFPKGMPKNQAEMNRYTESIPISVWNGSKKVTKYVTLHKALKEDVQAIFEDIANAKVQLKSIGGIRSFGTSMNNGGSSVSHHCYGVAIDLDPDYNPSGVYGGNPIGVRPGKVYYYTYPWQPNTQPLSIVDQGIIVRAFESRGWVWGAKWGTVSKPTRQPLAPGYHDFMHFSFTGH